MGKFRIYVDFVATPEALALLREGTAGHELIFPSKPAASVLATSERDPQFALADVAFGQPDPVSMAEAPHLKWVQISSSGITRYDTPEFRATMAKRGVAISNSASVYDEPCAVHVLSFMLAEARHLPLSLMTRTPSGTADWNGLRYASSTLRGETVLILGYGAIGKRLAELLAPFEVKISAYRRRARGDESVSVVTPENLERALGEADHVVNILPESAETRDFFTAARFKAIKRGAAFYNIGRGATVDQNALLDALRFGLIRSAWLDVTSPEPLPDDHPLWREPNCFITPHVAGGFKDETLALVRHFLKNFELFASGKPVTNRVI